VCRYIYLYIYTYISECLDGHGKHKERAIKEKAIKKRAIIERAIKTKPHVKDAAIHTRPYVEDAAMHTQQVMQSSTLCAQNIHPCPLCAQRASNQYKVSLGLERLGQKEKKERKACSFKWREQHSETGAT